MTKTNWVNDILDQAVKVVNAWPEWMKRPEVRMTGEYSPNKSPINNKGVIIWLDPNDCDPPHGLDMTAEHDLAKVEHLADQFHYCGFDKSKSALVGYVKDGRVQLLSGTHRHRAAQWAGIKLPVVLWLGSDIEKAWGDLDDWKKVIADIPVQDLEKWTREDLDRQAVYK